MSAYQEFLMLTEEEIAKELAQEAQVLRVKKGLTQKQFSEEIGIAYGTYIKFERLGTISLVGFLKIIRHLGRLKNIANILKIDEVQTVGIEKYHKDMLKPVRKRVR
ncbi:MAG: helix-turn-helix transcriptional regulator [Campylobacterota bacterium]|nr:helix-turn-helix transcriptional regulator [Campylobacterota bacterium]